MLRSIEGTVEVVIPDNDPDATVSIERISSHFGSPIDSAALAHAGVTVTLIGEKGTATNFSDVGVQAQKFGVTLPRELFQVGENEVGVRIVDPDGRIVGVEFQTREGGPLPYNHHGRSHFETGTGDGCRFDIYRLDPKISDDAKFVCWLITKKSLVKFPLKLANLSLPPPSR